VTEAKGHPPKESFGQKNRNKKTLPNREAGEGKMKNVLL
jgi:hypothetical protein